MGLKRRDFNKVIIAAFGGIVAGSTLGCASDGSEHAVADAGHECAGHNACKGHGGCEGGDNGCKGKNSCEGKGGCKTR